MQSHAQPNKQEPLIGPLPEGVGPADSFIREVKTAKDARSGILETLQAADSQEKADKAVHQAVEAVKAGSLTKEEFEEIVDELPSMVQGFVLGSEEADSILPEVKPLETSGVDEYTVTHARFNTDKTEAELNAMPELPANDDEGKKAA